jgi:uncharacterized heparinase superfamily protein
VWSPAVERATGFPCLTGPATVRADYIPGAGRIALTAYHDGYAPEFGLVHSRRLALSADGNRLEGMDRLSPATGATVSRGGVPFAVHFHLGPSIMRVTEAASGLFRLTLTDGSIWHFAASGIRASIEASADLTGPVVQNQRRQIVLRATCTGETRIEWSFQRLTGA